ncbi:MAG: cytochrome c oxidase subunit 3 [Caldilineaceae bacterium]|nr:cytochrome c oxidase subunit 3 [Caldilineaceae bacterium]
MSAAALGHKAEHGHGAGHADSQADYLEKTRRNRLGMWLFFVSEAFLFIGLLAARFYLWVDESGEMVRPDLAQVPGLAVTVILLLSSYFMNRAEISIANNKRRDFLTSLIITAILGTAFLVGVIVWEWGMFPSIVEGHLKPSDGVFGAVVFAMTGMHALHVLSGSVLILNVWWLGRKGHFSPEQHWGVEAVAIYWHYVDLVWIFFYPAIYLIGHAYGAH